MNDGRCKSSVDVNGVFKPIAVTTTVATTNDDDMTTTNGDDDESAMSHVQRHGLEDLDRRSRKTSPAGVPHEFADAKTEKVEFSSLKAPADEESLETSSLNVAPGGNTRAANPSDLFLQDSRGRQDQDLSKTRGAILCIGSSLVTSADADFDSIALDRCNSHEAMLRRDGSKPRAWGPTNGESGWSSSICSLTVTWTTFALQMSRICRGGCGR